MFFHFFLLTKENKNQNNILATEKKKNFLKKKFTIRPLFKKITISNYQNLFFVLEIKNTNFLNQLKKLNQNKQQSEYKSQQKKQNYYYLKLMAQKKVLWKKKGIIQQNNQRIKLDILNDRGKPFFQLTNGIIFQYAFQFGDFFTAIVTNKINSDNIQFVYDSQSLLAIDKELQQWTGEKKLYLQTADIDLSTIENFKPIGNALPKNKGYEITKCFRGIYNGNGYQINNLTISRPNKKFVGLFECLFDDGIIYNLILTNVKIKGGEFVGGVVGGSKNSMISNCHVYGEISGNEKVGGIVGANKKAKINYSFFRGKLKAMTSVGGIVGENNSTSSVENSSSIATIVAEKYNAGGIVGLNINKGKVLQCYSFSSVRGKKDVGGIVGDNKHFSKILNSYSVGNAIGEYGVGGVAGYNVDSIIDYCYAQVKHKGKGGVGSLVGYSIRSQCNNSYAVGYQIGEQQNKQKLQYMSFKWIRENRFKEFNDKFWIRKKKHWPILKQVASAPKQKLRLY